MRDTNPYGGGPWDDDEVVLAAAPVLERLEADTFASEGEQERGRGGEGGNGTF